MTEDDTPEPGGSGQDATEEQSAPELEVTTPADPELPQEYDSVQVPKMSGMEEVVDGTAQALDPEPASDPQVVAGPSEHQQVLTALSTLEAKVEQYNDRFIAYESQVTRYHSEAVKLRDRSLLEDLKPLINSLITIHARLHAMTEEFDPVGEKTRRNGLYSLADDVEMALDELGLESLDVQPGDTFQPRQHVGKNRIDTADPEADRKVAEVLKQGFAEHGTNFEEGNAKFAAQVNVYRYREPEQTKPSPAAAEAGTVPAQVTASPNDATIATESPVRPAPSTHD